MDPSSPQSGILIQGLTNEAQVGIGEAAAQGLEMKALGRNGTADRIGVEAKFSGNGPDLPMLGVKVTTNLGAGLGTNHRVFLMLFWGWWERDRRNGPAGRS